MIQRIQYQELWPQPKKMKFTVAQLGSRMHYAVPRIFRSANCLERLFTDFYTREIATGPFKHSRLVKAIASRRPKDIEPDFITAFNSLGLEYAVRQRVAPKRRLNAYLWAGRSFCNRIVRHGLGSADAVYAFNSAAKELFTYARKTGIHTVLEQTIVPKRIEQQILLEESDRWPGWEHPEIPTAQSREFAEREEEEWAQSDIVICPSEFVSDGITKSRRPARRCVIVPYGVDRSLPQKSDTRRDSSTLNVLFVGRLGLRKGLPYLLQAANLIDASQFKIRAAGTSDLLPNALSVLGSRIEILGPVPRSTLDQLYLWADVFVLPTLCEGSATVTYEALAAGLPVITTPNCGSVVRDGIDGYIVPVRRPEIIAERLGLLRSNPELVREMSANARERAQEYTLTRYSERLLAAIGLTN